MLAGSREASSSSIAVIFAAAWGTRAVGGGLHRAGRGLVLGAPDLARPSSRPCADFGSAASTWRSVDQQRPSLASGKPRAPVPEAQRPVADASTGARIPGGRSRAAGRPRLRRLPVAAARARAPAPVSPHADHHQQAQFVLLQPDASGSRPPTGTRIHPDRSRATKPRSPPRLRQPRDTAADSPAPEPRNCQRHEVPETARAGTAAAAPRSLGSRPTAASRGEPPAPRFRVSALSLTRARSPPPRPRWSAPPRLHPLRTTSRGRPVPPPAWPHVGPPRPQRPASIAGPLPHDLIDQRREPPPPSGAETVRDY